MTHEEDRWFSHEENTGYVTHATEDEAVSFAEGTIDDYRDEAIDWEWAEEVERVCVGRITRVAKRVPMDAEFIYPPGSCEEDFCNYVLSEPEPPPPIDPKLRGTLRVLVDAISENGFRYQWTIDADPSTALYACEGGNDECGGVYKKEPTLGDHAANCPLTAALRHAREVTGKDGASS